MFDERETRMKPGVLLIFLLLLLVGLLLHKAGEVKGRNICEAENHTTTVYIEKQCDPCEVCITPEPKVIQTNHTIYMNHTKWMPCNESKDIKIIRQLKWCESELADRRNESILLEVIDHINESLKTNSSALDECLLDLCEVSNRTQGCREGG